MISPVRLFWTHYNSSLIFQIHRSAIATPGLSPLGRGGYILLSPSRLATTVPRGIGPYVYRSQNKTQAGEQANRPLNKL